MRRFAVIADIHGNSDALGAVLADIDSQGIGQIINLGDHFSGPLDAAGTAARLRSREMLSICGNHDRYLITREPAAMGRSDRVAYDQLSFADLDWLRALPKVLELEGGIFACHGVPRSDESYWLERVGPDGVPRTASLSEIEAEAEGVDAGLILCAHTHIPRLVRLPDGRIILNPGSVGCPAYDDDEPVPHKMQTGSPHASYAVVERRAAGWQAAFRYVAYDNAAMVARAEAEGRAEWARALTTGWLE
ncbi:metallophosphoesterase family protein [Thioclava kandeliae]|uniref:Metallophosphoesterase family protein n=1 Tax=Thioclava kandeliae TaxID=3070818 RepID=A0ABV1SBN7_9RHOB